MTDPDRPPPGDEPASSQASTRASDPAGGDSHAPERPVAPRRLGDFEVLREVGRGGMGVVYEARQLSLDRRVALKVLPPALGLGPQAAQRFQREAHAAAKLHHTNIVPVYAIDEEEGSHFYAMELVEGQPLDRILDDLSGGQENPLMASGGQENPLMAATVTRAAGGEESRPADVGTATAATAATRPAGIQPPGTTSSTTSLSDTSTGGRRWFDAVARLIEEVASALDYAHGRGIIHRDIKPGNLLLSGDGRLMITDFGLARILQEPGMTVSGSFLGTPAYMSPEQIVAGRMKIDHRTDVYSLGTVLYEMLVLRRPFPGDSREEVITQIMTKDPRPPRRFNHRIPLDLETICLKALEKDPDRRYQSAGEMARDLHHYLHGGLITARRAGVLRRSWKSIRRHPVTTVTIVWAILIAAVGGLAWRASAQRTEQEIHRHLADARFSLSQGEHREALRKADLVLAAAPDEAEARLIRARTLVYLWRGQEALDEALTSLETDPDDWVGHLVVAYAAKMGTFYAGEIEPHIQAVERLAPETADAYNLRALASESATEALAHLDRALEIAPGDGDALWQRGWRHIELKDFPAALADADRLIAAEPRSAWGRLLKAGCYWNLHDGDAALAEIERAIRLHPDEPSNYFWRGNLYRLFFQDYKKGLADLSTAIEMDPENSAFYNSRAWCHIQMGQFDEALADGERARELNPDNPWLMSVPGEVSLRRQDHAEYERLLEEAHRQFKEIAEPKALAEYYNARADGIRRWGDYPRALTDADKAVELDPDRWQAYLIRARLKSLLGDAEGAADDCDRAMAIELDEPDELWNRGLGLGESCDRKEAAIRDFTRCIELAPAWADPYNGRAVQNIFLGRWDEAHPDLDRCIELADRWTVCHSNRSIVRQRLGRYAAALEDNDTVLRLTPESPWAYLHRAGILDSLSRVEEALAAADKAIALAPSLPYPYLARAGILAIHGGPCERVEEDIHKALELDPAERGAMAGLASLHVFGLFYGCPELYSLETALEKASTAVEQAPDNEAARRALGAALYRSGRHEEAIEHQMKALATFGGEATDLFLLAMEHWQLGNRSEARDYYRRAVTWMEEHNPDHPRLLRLRDEASELLGVEP